MGKLEKFFIWFWLATGFIMMPACCDDKAVSYKLGSGATVSCKGESEYHCGLHLYQCEDKQEYYCQQNVTVIP